jgi:NAD(P)H-flavin reductase
MSVVNCSINKISQLNPFMHQIEMTPSSDIQFKAGQYLKLILPNNKNKPFSIISSPSQENIVIHMGSSGGDAPLSDALDFCIRNKNINVEAGFGDAYFQSAINRPIILFAAGSGFSYVKSIAQHLAETNHQAPVLLYWGVRVQDRLYSEIEMFEWTKQNPLFSFIPVIKHPELDWKGRSGALLDVLLEDIKDLSDYDIYLAGRFDLMPKVRKAMLNNGASLSNMFSDAFAYI